MFVQAFQNDDFPLFLQTFLSIPTKEHGLQPFKLWPHQLQMWQDRLNLVKAGKWLWRLYLKYRQGGFSKFFLAEDFWLAITRPHFNVLIIAHEKSLPTEFLDIIRLWIEELPEWARPKVKSDSASQIVFDAPLYSSIRIGTAQTTMDAGGIKIGRTIQRLHITEAAEPVFDSRKLYELFQTVPKNCEVVVESTAKGIGTWFYKTYWDKVSKFTRYFVPWKVHIEYVLPVPLDFEPDDDELALMTDHGLTPEQLMWRRMKLEEGHGDLDKFKEQYPLTDVEAFMHSGHSCFSLPDLAHFLDSPDFCKDWPTQTGYLTTEDEKLVFKPGKNGNLEIYRMPEEGEDYCIAMDVAEGLVDGDFSVATVWKGVEQVAEWHGHTDPHDFADVGADLGYYYNEALLVPEDNAMGSVTVARLFRDLYYPNLYYRENRATADDKVSTKRIGWHTSGTNKPDMVSELALHIKNWRRTGFTPHSERLVNECRTFDVFLDRRGQDRYAAQSGCNDDCPIGAMIALQGMLSWQYGSAPIERAGGDVDKALKQAGIRQVKEPASRYERAMKRARHGTREWGQA